MRSRSIAVFRVLLILCAAPAFAQDFVCVTGPVGSRYRSECESSDGCWLFQLPEKGIHDVKRGIAYAGCMRSHGQEALYILVSGEFRGVTLQDAISSLTSGLNLTVKILGDPSTKVSLAYSERPLQLVLLDLQRISGVTLETSWLPRFNEGDRFSFAANGKAAAVARVLFAVSGTPVVFPVEAGDLRIKLSLSDVNIEQAKREFLRALRKPESP